jgi:hypothetical protein
MEQTTTYVVQHWNERYQTWGTVSEPTTGMFDIPKFVYEAKAEAVGRLSGLREAHPGEKYQMLRQVTTVEEI